MSCTQRSAARGGDCGLRNLRGRRRHRLLRDGADSIGVPARALGRAEQAEISFDPPQVLRAERDEAVILVSGSIALAPNLGAAVPKEWSIGEALVNVNYRVSGKQAAYVYAKAEKRAKDRVILKLIGLHGLLYSEEEADEFRARASSEHRVRA